MRSDKIKSDQIWWNEKSAGASPMTSQSQSLLICPWRLHMYSCSNNDLISYWNGCHVKSNGIAGRGKGAVGEVTEWTKSKSVENIPRWSKHRTRPEQEHSLKSCRRKKSFTKFVLIQFDINMSKVLYFSSPFDSIAFIIISVTCFISKTKGGS